MNNYRIFPILKSFRKKEINKFRKFLKSSYFNTGKKLLAFYEILIKYHPTYDSEELSNENIYKMLYPNRNFKISTIKNLYFDLKNVLEMYFVVYNTFNNNIEEKFSLIKEFNNRNLIKHTGGILSKLKKELQKEKADSSYFYNKFHYGFENFNFLANNQLISNITKQKLEIESLGNTVINLIKFFIVNLINAYINTIVFDNNDVTNQTKNMCKNFMVFFDIKKIMNILPLKDKKDHVLEIYSALADTFLKINNEAAYFKYKSLVKKYSNKLSNDEISFHYSTMMIYSVMKKNQNKKKFVNELLELYSTYLNREYYKDKKTSYLLPEKYRGILVTGLEMKKYNWTNNFIEKYTKRLPPNSIDNMYNWAKANYYYSTNDFKKAIDYLNLLEYEHFIFKYDAYNIRLKIYYERGQYKLALDTVDAFKKALKTDKIISRDRYIRYKNFLYYINKAILHFYANERIDIKFLNNKLRSNNDVVSRSWLIERYNIIAQKKISKYSSVA